MDNDEFGFKSLAESFKPEFEKEKQVVQATPVIPKPVPSKPTPAYTAPPELPQVTPQEVTANVPQMPPPQAPEIQNPVFNPEFQKAALTSLAPALLAGAGALGGAAYGAYKAKKTADRMIGETKGIAPSEAPKLDSQWQTILAQSEKNRLAKQAEAQKKIADNLAVQQSVDAVHQIDLKGVPDSIQATLQPESTVKQNKIPQMMAGQEMRNPLGGLASSYTEPIRPPSLPQSEIPTIADLTSQVVGTAPVAPPTTTSEIATQVEGKKKGRPTKEAAAKSMEGLTFRGDLGPGDNWLYNSFGSEGRKAILAKYNEGKPAGSYEEAQQIFKKMQEEKVGPGRSELPRDIAKERGVPPPETNYGKLGKAAKMGGVAGLALTAHQLTQAKDLAELRRSLGETLLPLGVTPSELQSGTLGPEQLRAFQEAQKLGSPYRQKAR
jgi:hypothetical protein